MSIQYASDGNTLIDGAGNRVSVFDARYGDLLAIRSAQAGAVIENNTAADRYTFLVSAAQSNADRGLPYPALPDKPRQKVIDDTGVASYVAFVPPLPDVVIPAPSAPPVAVGIANTAAAGPDKNAIMYAMVSALYHKAFPEVTP